MDSLMEMLDTDRAGTEPGLPSGTPKPTTPQQVADRALSTSFIAALEPALQSEVLDEVRQIAEAVGDSFDFPYRSELQAWKSLQGGNH